MFEKVGERYKGFTVRRIRTSDEFQGRMVELVYEKTGTDVIWMDNGLANKLFSIIFKTLPEDSTGVFHILEHSLLNGSKKYPVREPFVELLKTSMNTFLNAITFSDMTMFPVSISSILQEYILMLYLLRFCWRIRRSSTRRDGI